MAKNPKSIATPTIHLVGPGKIKVINGRLAFSTGKGPAARLDPGRLETVVCYGNVGITDDAFAMLFANDVEVSWLINGITARLCKGLSRRSSRHSGT